jgi:glycosyltransferase involved in cell wall biosynthesis
MSDQVLHTPAVSVMLCTNVWDTYCDRALLSIESQTFTDFEIVIVANGMDDGTFLRLNRRASDPRVRVFRTSIAGVTFSRNLALHHCRAPLLAVMDADDIAYPGRLAAQVEFLKCHPKVTVCGTSYDIIDADNKKIGNCIFPTLDRDIRRSLVWRNPLCHPTTMLRTDRVRAVGGYSGNSAEDYELWIRLAEDAESQFANLEETLLGYRVPVVSVARRSRRAYVHTAGAKFRVFALTKNASWLFATLFTLLKAWFRANRP